MTPQTQLLPLDDGRILVCCREETRGDGVDQREGAHAITLLDPRGGTLREQVLGAPSGGPVALRLLPGSGTDLLGLVITVDDRGCSTIWRVAAPAPQFTRLADIPGVLLGGVWLDDAATLLGINRAGDDGAAEAVAVDLRNGSWTTLLAVTSDDRLLLASSRSGLVVVGTGAPGKERLGWGRLSAREPVRFPEMLRRPSQELWPLALDPEGQCLLLLQLDQGVRSGLAIYVPATDRPLTGWHPSRFPRDTSAAQPTGSARHSGFPSPPLHPPGVATARIGEAGAWSLAGSATDGTRWADGHVEHFQGPGGPIEAIVYGGEGWLASERLVLALHGGPGNAWRLEFEPLFQRLAAADIAVVAPNQRGSGGYGIGYTLPVHGAWGGPDLDDVCCIARALVTQRRALGAGCLMLLGVAYGAYLALLAASCEPDSWSRCVALTPFLSGPRLHREASSAIQELVEGLDGRQELHDRIGPRDVLRLCRALRAKLLVVHGDRDEVIPVSQSRLLRRRLLELGRREGVDFDYLEFAGSGHELLTKAGGHAVHERLVRFLLAPDHSDELVANPQRRETAL